MASTNTNIMHASERKCSRESEEDAQTNMTICIVRFSFFVELCGKADYVKTHCAVMRKVGRNLVVSVKRKINQFFCRVIYFIINLIGQISWFQLASSKNVGFMPPPPSQQCDTSDLDLKREDISNLCCTNGF